MPLLLLAAQALFQPLTLQQLRYLRRQVCNLVLIDEISLLIILELRRRPRATTLQWRVAAVSKANP
jgi:hypothetical protein